LLKRLKDTSLANDLWKTVRINGFENRVLFPGWNVEEARMTDLSTFINF